MDFILHSQVYCSVSNHYPGALLFICTTAHETEGAKLFPIYNKPYSFCNFWYFLDFKIMKLLKYAFSSLEEMKHFLYYTTSKNCIKEITYR